LVVGRILFFPRSANVIVIELRGRIKMAKDEKMSKPTRAKLEQAARGYKNRLNDKEDPLTRLEKEALNVIKDRLKKDGKRS
jgi:hypothetical protein